MSFFFFQLLRYQNAKINEKHTVWRKRKTLPKSCNLNVFFHIVRQQNTIMLARYTRKLNNNVRNVFLCVFQRVMHENAKQHGKHFIQKCKITLLKACLLSVLNFLRSKTLNHVQQTRITLPNRKTLPKTCILSLFQSVTYINLKMQNALCMWKRQDITRNVHYQCFESLRYQTLNRLNEN